MVVKQGGNSDVKISDGVATKTLRRGSTQEKRARFIREVEIVQEIQSRNRYANLIEMLEMNMDDEPPWYSMKAYTGDANDILEDTKGNIVESANLLVPIVTTLKELSEQEVPIYHRDLKPDNLLFETVGGDTQLILADFGCAFLKTDGEDRLTKDFRAVGAMAYRAPEYHYGRVEDVNEKGDIFSLGKLLWYLINGVKGEVFPYTLWFPEEYSLSKRFPGLAGIERANLLVASTVHHDPAQRIGYWDLLLSLETLGSKTEMTPEETKSEQILKYESSISLKREERLSIVRNLIQTFLQDIRHGLSELVRHYADSNTLKSLQSSCRLLYPIQDTLTTVIDRESDCPLWNESQQNLRIDSRIYPVKPQPDVDSSTQFPHADLRCKATNSEGVEQVFHIAWHYESSSGLYQTCNGEKKAHDKENAFNVLHSLFLHLIS